MLGNPLENLNCGVKDSVRVIKKYKAIQSLKFYMLSNFRFIEILEKKKWPKFR